MSSSEYEEQPDYQDKINPYMGGMYGFNNSDLVKLALNTADILEDLKISLFALEYDPKIQGYVPSKIAKPLINELGSNQVLTVIRSLVNRNTTLSNLNEDEINRIAHGIGLALNDNFLINWRMYWPDSTYAASNWQTVILIATNSIIMSLKRALNNSEAQLLGGNTKTFIQKSEMDSSQRISQGTPPRMFPINKLFK